MTTTQTHPSPAPHVRPTYVMRHYTITAPVVDNDGLPRDYPGALRAELIAAGVDGWTETHSVGYWRGKAEPGTLFTLYLEQVPGRGIDLLAHLARAAMPDQDCPQVTYHGTITLVEA